MTRHSYVLHGLVVDSAIRFRGVPEAAPGSSADLTIHDHGIGEVSGEFTPAAVLSMTVDGIPWSSLGRNDAGWEFRYPTIASMQIDEGLARIDVVRAARADPELLSLLVGGGCLGAHALLRGLVALHASAMVTSHGVVAFAGPSMQGKSSTAALAALGGARLFADDLLCIDLAVWPPRAFRGVPVVRLRRSPERNVRAIADFESWSTVDGRTAVRFPTVAEPALSLAAIAIPTLSADGCVSVSALDSAQAFRQLTQCMRVNGWTEPALQRRGVAETAELARRVPCLVVSLPVSRGVDPAVGRELVRALEDLPGVATRPAASTDL